LNRSRYSLAAKNVHFVKGTLLEYDGVYLAEGPWPGEAYHDAAKREASRSRPVPLNYASSKAPRVSRGPYEQHTEYALPIHENTIEPVDEELPLQRAGGRPPVDGPALRPQEQPLPPPESQSSVNVQPIEEPAKASDGSAGKSTVVVLTSGTDASAEGGVPQIRFRPDPAAESTKPAPQRPPPAKKP
jgi:hypothetical protein